MRSLGAERSVDLFSPVSWTDYDASVRADADYPGLRPTGSWRLSPNGELHGLDAAGPGWRDRTTGEMVDLSGRCWVLAYGSNADPAKLLAKVGFFCGNSVIAVRAAVFGWAAAWRDARRGTDRSVVALCLKHGLVPPHLHLTAVNPAIDLNALNLAIPTQTETAASRPKMTVHERIWASWGQPHQPDQR